MSRQEYTRRRHIKHGCMIGGYALLLACFATFAVGVAGAFGYVERGGDIATGIIVAVLSLALAALLGAIGYALEKGAQE